MSDHSSLERLRRIQNSKVRNEYVGLSSDNSAGSQSNQKYLKYLNRKKERSNSINNSNAQSYSAISQKSFDLRGRSNSNYVGRYLYQKKEKD